MEPDVLEIMFRRWLGDYSKGHVIALFPNIITSYEGKAETVVSYEHVGQHGDANYDYVVSRTASAMPEEYAPLLAELKTIYGSEAIYGDNFQFKICARRPIRRNDA